jgi:hypothetical protein
MRDLLGDPAAHQLLRRAYEAAYQFPQNFGGFKASLYYARDTESTAGSVEVRSPSDIRFGSTLESIDGRLDQELTSIVRHRWSVPYEEADGRYQLTLAPSEHPLGRLVRVERDGMDSSYRVQGGHICQINRNIGGLHFSIHIQERTFTGDARALPVHFCVVYWNTAEGRVIRTDIYRDGYIPVGDVHLPLSRRITTADDSGITTRLILLRDHRLLSESSAERKAG